MNGNLNVCLQTKVPSVLIATELLVHVVTCHLGHHPSKYRDYGYKTLNCRG